MDNFTDFELLADIDSVAQTSNFLAAAQSTQGSELPVDHEESHAHVFYTALTTVSLLPPASTQHNHYSQTHHSASYMATCAYLLDLVSL
ncbi:hypothetical protein LshimejAT787_1602500 [Lyophyllum shimeji]|uniref:Uncharacterized protein n=1 Tax=Lyophyllum shimeji TaxID=47721 RepID=A0A9P3UU38_LYOSH|nr:hypothetical protein LshimejAT787_1602500 [Lyophyllum shimeji]